MRWTNAYTGKAVSVLVSLVSKLVSGVVNRSPFTPDSLTILSEFGLEHSRNDRPGESHYSTTTAAPAMSRAPTSQCRAATDRRATRECLPTSGVRVRPWSGCLERSGTGANGAGFVAVALSATVPLRPPGAGGQRTLSEMPRAALLLLMRRKGSKRRGGPMLRATIPSGCDDEVVVRDEPRGG